MKRKINQILANGNNIQIYVLPSLLIFSFFLRLLTTYFIRDYHFDNEWNILLDNLILHKSYSYYSFNDQLIPSVLLPPLYPFFLYSMKLITTFDKDNLLYAVIFIQIILSTYSVYLFYQLNQIYFTKKLSLISSFIFSVVPLNIIACGQISSVTLQVFFLLLFLNFLFLVINNSANKNIAIFSIISSFLILIRGEFILFFILMLFFTLIKKKITLLNLIKILIIVSLIISPYLIRNYIHFDKFIIVKSQGYNLWKGNNELSKVEGFETLEKKEFTKLKNKIDDLTKNKYYEIHKDKIFLDYAIYNISNNPLRYLILYIKKIFSFYFVDIKSTYKDYYNFFHIFPILIISLLSVPGLFIFFKKNKFENKSLGFFLILNLMVFSIFFILPRYKLGILPIQIILVTYFLEYLIEKFNKT